MSPSSSGSWSGAGGADIIDLDRYMRGGVRPSRGADYTNRGSSEQLVVDAGGATRKLSPQPSDARLKRFSQDSGVSDGSYSRRHRRSYRPEKPNSVESSYIRPTRDQISARTVNGRANSSSSLRAFRAVCEQALLDQQQQIARVAQICERLAERADRTEVEKSDYQKSVEKIERSEKSERSVKINTQKERLKLQRRRERLERAGASESSDLSSSSRSTKDLRRKDKYRTQECKTYKIIMNKLDELNRMYTARPAMYTRRRAPSSASVSVCDKLVATEPRLPATHVSRCRKMACSDRSVSLSRHRAMPTVTQAFAVDIAPSPPPTIRHNVVIDSVVNDDSSVEVNVGCKHSSGDPRCGFDLDDPVHLYSQAKRLQTLTATTRRARSLSPSSRLQPRADSLSSHHTVAVASAPGAAQTRQRSPSLCAVCRASWRCMRRCLAATLLGKSVDCS